MTDAVELGQVIAERRFILDPDETVIVRLGLPITHAGPPEESWCPYQVEGLGTGKVRRAFGIDALQSIWLALVTIGSQLYESQEYKAGRLHPGGGDPDLGLPVFDALRHLVPTVPPRPEGFQDPQ